MNYNQSWLEEAMAAERKWRWLALSELLALALLVALHALEVLR